MQRGLFRFFRSVNVEVLVVIGMLAAWMTLQAVVFPALGVPS